MTIDGRCACCGDLETSGGCARCTSSITYCGCGARIVCGCGARFEHLVCPAVTIVGTTSSQSTAEIAGTIVPSQSTIETGTVLPIPSLFDVNIW
jgi:hypothetical protein